MSDFVIQTVAGNDREASLTATWPQDVPEASASEGDPYPLDSATRIRFVAKVSPANTDEQAVAIYEEGSGLEVDGETGGVQNIAHVVLDGDDTQQFATQRGEVRLYAYVDVRTGSGDDWTVAEGTWRVAPAGS